MLFLDTPSGIAGDMTVAALIDLGVPLAVVTDAISRLELEEVRVSASPARSGVVGGTRFHVEVTGAHPERRYAEIVELLDRSSLETRTRSLARRVFHHLAEAESEVHRMPLDDVTFHEVGAVDAIVDIVGACAAFDFLRARVLATPLPMSRGFVRCEHGWLPLPAPATLLCLRGVPTYPSGLDVELVTPTGAAILASVAEGFVAWPKLTPECVGFGCGTRRLADGRPNALRAVLGTEPSTAAVESAPASSSHVVLSANVDDMTGELAGYVIERLFHAGALDAWAEPVTMKKGRPGLILCALGQGTDAAALAGVILRETNSIGVRSSSVSRFERPRRVLQVDTRFGTISVKVSEGDYGSPLAKPEFEDCARAAREYGVPLRDVLTEAQLAFAKLAR
ncbi:MAG TPA: nickel pincer cofactor biosynthesis protein LarC [Polyangiaceae bacterium]|nr:nickel pincer cofactor biosynthesis protein LarC [Polyangiaceae bacterium]